MYPRTLVSPSREHTGSKSTHKGSSKIRTSTSPNNIVSCHTVSDFLQICHICISYSYQWFMLYLSHQLLNLHYYFYYLSMVAKHVFHKKT